MEFQLRKIGHVVLNVSDLEAATRFYTDVLGLRVTDRYPDSMMPGGMVFLCVNVDHHGIALVGGGRPRRDQGGGGKPQPLRVRGGLTR